VSTARGNVESTWATMALEILPSLTSAGCQIALANHILRSWLDWLDVRLLWRRSQHSSIQKVAIE